MNPWLHLVLAFILLSSCSYAQPIDSPIIPILKSDSDGPNPDGSYKFSFQTANGINVQEEGHAKESNSYEVLGFYQYTTKEGKPVTVLYFANENGFKVESDIVPTAPPIPPLILRGLAYNAAHPEQDNIDGKNNTNK